MTQSSTMDLRITHHSYDTGDFCSGWEFEGVTEESQGGLKAVAGGDLPLSLSYICRGPELCQWLPELLDKRPPG